MPYLVLDSGSGERVQYRITETGLRLGRDPDCDLVLPSDAASRHHATVSLEGGRTHFRDEKSHNGSFVNGRRVESAVLAEGDRILVGGFTVTYLERDPYGEDSIVMPIQEAAEAIEAASRPPVPAPAAKAATPTAKATTPSAKATTPSAKATTPSAKATTPTAKAATPTVAAPRSVPVLLLAGVFGVTIALLALFAWVAWQVLPDDLKKVPAAGATPATATPSPMATVTNDPPWRDADGIVEVTTPSDFSRGEAAETSIQFVGPPGTKFASSITVEVTPASSGATTAAEHALVERSLAAELGSRFQRLSAGPLTVAAEPMMFLQYQRTTSEGVLIQNWLVLGVKDGHRVAFRLTGEMAQWDRLRGLFGGFLTQVRFPASAPGELGAAEPTAPAPEAEATAPPTP